MSQIVQSHPQDIPLQRCNGPCGRMLPATEEFFFIRKRKNGTHKLRIVCKKCHNKGRDERREAKMESDAPLKRCPSCPEGEQWHPATHEFFVRSSTSKDGLRPLCKACNRQKVAAQRKRQSIETPVIKIIQNQANGHSQGIQQEGVSPLIHRCGSCGTTRGNIFGDIDESTKERYGYICMKCYRILHEFGDDLNRIRDVLAYIERTRLSHV